MCSAIGLCLVVYSHSLRADAIGFANLFFLRFRQPGEGSAFYGVRALACQTRNTTRLETRTKESSGAASRRLNESHRAQ